MKKSLTLIITTYSNENTCIEDVAAIGHFLARKQPLPQKPQLLFESPETGPQDTGHNLKDIFR
jgi:hypothetical protein